MAVFSPLTSRRFSTRKAEPTQQLIVFRLANDGFALPIRAVDKVIPMGKIYGHPQGAGLGLTLYQEQELLVIDVNHRIFRGLPRQDSSALAAASASLAQPVPATPLHPPLPQDTCGQGFLLIVHNCQGKRVGLPLDSPPSLQRVPESAFTPLTSDYLSQGTIRCVSALIVVKHEPLPLFLLNPDLLVQPQSSLPPARS